MKRRAQTTCYIEEYQNEQGQLCVRLREKTSGRKVDLGFTTRQNLHHFLTFLQKAAMCRGAMPDLFSKERYGDSVIVAGAVDVDKSDEIRFIYDSQLAYYLD